MSWSGRESGWTGQCWTGRAEAVELLALVSLAVVAGVVSFTSPCCLPLLPGYISYVSALSASGADRGGTEGPVAVRKRRRVLTGAGLFVAGFTAVFTVLGLTASALGLLLVQNLRSVNVVAGGFVLAMGLATLGVIRVPVLARRLQFDLTRVGRGPAGAFPLGAAFAFGWTPCVGPVLASILTTAASTATLSQGALLLAAYSAGLGVPFLLLAGWLASGRRRPEWLARNSRRIEIGGGLVLVATGLALMTGRWTALMSGVLAAYARLGWPPI